MGFSVRQLFIVLAIVVILFGTQKLNNTGSGLGPSIKSFKKVLSDQQSDNKQVVERSSLLQTSHKK